MPTRTITNPTTMSPRRRWAAMAVLVLPVLLISIDMTVLGFALPSLSAQLRPSGIELLWIVDIYSFLLAGLLLLMGGLGDRIGRRRLLVGGAVVFGTASVLAAFAPNPEVLIAARALLGVGGATLMPSTLSLIRTVFTDQRERRTAIAVWSSAFGGGTALGPILGGWLLEHFWWGSVFLINVPVMALLLAGARLLPESRSDRRGRIDVVSAVLSIAGMLPVVYAVKHAGTHGPDLTSAAALVLGAGLLTLFVRRQRVLADPLLDTTLFGRRVFTSAVLVNLMSMVAFIALLFFLPQYLQSVLGMSPLHAGLWTLPLVVSSIVGAMAAPSVATRVPPHVIVGVGTLVGGMGFLAAAALVVVDGPVQVLLLVTHGLLVGGGIGLAEPLTNDAVVTSAPPERAGGAAAVSETAYELGGALGTAVLGTLGLAVYRRLVLGGAPDGLSVQQQTTAGDTIGGAVTVAQDLPARMGEALLATARDAFSTGMALAMLAAALVCAVSGVIGLVGLREPRSTGRAAARSERESQEVAP